MPNVMKPDPAVLGKRLTEARKARGLTQEDVASHLGCSRPTLIAIEKGTREAKSDEIIALASLFGRSVHELVHPIEPVSSLQPHLRVAISKTGRQLAGLDEAIIALQRFADNYWELEQITNSPLVYHYPPEVKITERIDVIALAEDMATRERNRLGLGDQPIHQLRSILEFDLGLRILYGSLPSPVAGMYAYAGDVGCCIIINRKHPAERRRATLVHEYGHVITDRYKPGIDYLSTKGRKPANERFAETFSMAFLMPATSVRRRFNDIVATSGDFQVSDLCRLSHFYFVSVEAMAYRLEGLGLIPGGTIQHLRESKFEVGKAKELLKLPAQPETSGSFPQRYIQLAVQAYEEALISEGQLASFFECDRVTAREIVDRWSRKIDVNAEGQVEERHYNVQQSLLSEM